MFENCKIVFLHVCDQPTGCTSLPGLQEYFVKQASAASGLLVKVQKYNFAIFKHILRLPEAPKQQKKTIFRASRSSLICGAQKTKITVFRFASLFLWECPTSYTLYQPWRFRAFQAKQFHIFKSIICKRGFTYAKCPLFIVEDSTVHLGHLV